VTIIITIIMVIRS